MPQQRLRRHEEIGAAAGADELLVGGGDLVAGFEAEMVRLDGTTFWARESSRGQRESAAEQPVGHLALVRRMQGRLEVARRERARLVEHMASIWAQLVPLHATTAGDVGGNATGAAAEGGAARLERQCDEIVALLGATPTLPSVPARAYSPSYQR